MKRNMTGCIVQALVSQGISIALGCTFTTQPADHLIVSPRSRGSNLRDKPDPCGNLTYRMMYSVLVHVYCSQKDRKCQEKRITQKITEITRFEAYCPLYTDAKDQKTRTYLRHYMLV